MMTAWQPVDMNMCHVFITLLTKGHFSFVSAIAVFFCPPGTSPFFSQKSIYGKHILNIRSYLLMITEF